tara:strand:- start:1583 stop:1795 length:213 start_codon:yes stop_codon:yes gene_type:complete
MTKEKIPKLKKRKPIHTPAGVFESRDAAAAHYGVKGPNLNYYLWRYPAEYYYIPSTDATVRLNTSDEKHA